MGGASRRNRDGGDGIGQSGRLAPTLRPMNAEDKARSSDVRTLSMPTSYDAACWAAFRCSCARFADVVGATQAFERMGHDDDALAKTAIGPPVRPLTPRANTTPRVQLHTLIHGKSDGDAPKQETSDNKSGVKPVAGKQGAAKKPTASRLSPRSKGCQNQTLEVGLLN